MTSPSEPWEAPQALRRLHAAPPISPDQGATVLPFRDSEGRARPGLPSEYAHLAYLRCFDRACAALAMGDDRRARQWLNVAAQHEGLPIPWPESGWPSQAARD